MIEAFLVAKELARLARNERELFTANPGEYQPQDAPGPIRARAVGHYQAVKAGRQTTIFAASETFIINPALDIMRNFPAAKDAPAIAWATAYCEGFLK